MPVLDALLPRLAPTGRTAKPRRDLSVPRILEYFKFPLTKLLAWTTPTCHVDGNDPWVIRPGCSSLNTQPTTLLCPEFAP